VLLNVILADLTPSTLMTFISDAVKTTLQIAAAFSLVSSDGFGKA